MGLFISLQRSKETFHISDRSASPTQIGSIELAIFSYLKLPQKPQPISVGCSRLLYKQCHQCFLVPILTSTVPMTLCALVSVLVNRWGHFINLFCYNTVWWLSSHTWCGVTHFIIPMRRHFVQCLVLKITVAM